MNIIIVRLKRYGPVKNSCRGFILFRTVETLILKFVLKLNGLWAGTHQFCQLVRNFGTKKLMNKI